MIKRLLLLLCLVFYPCFLTWANQEYSINLDKEENGRQTIELPYGVLTFELETVYSNVAKVRVIIENTAMNHAILLFKDSHDEQSLKRYKPKFAFEKTYPGGKGYRSVVGCKNVIKYFTTIVPAETANIFTFDALTTSTVRLTIPIYLAKYNSKKLLKSGKDKINYKILAEDIIDIKIQVKAWSENEPSYVQTKNAVADFMETLKTAKFCPNKDHYPSLIQQQKPYKEKLDSLVNIISGTLHDSEWMSTDEPYKAYDALLQQLQSVNLDSCNYDCNNHSVTKHSCIYCNLSAQDIYHQLDDLYQQLLTGEVMKDAAVKKAKALYNCYQNSTRRKKESFYSGKITEFYNRILR